MNLKKIISTLLLLTLLLMHGMPLGWNQTIAQEKKDSLYSFLNSTENLRAAYDYPSLVPSAPAAAKVKLSAQTPIVIRSATAIKPKEIVSGDYVRFTVVNDVKGENGIVLIKANSPVSASLSFAKDPGPIGKSGSLTVSDFHATAVDGTFVPLSGTVSSNPDDKMVLSIILSVLLCPLFLLMKGEYAEVPAGITKTVYTSGDVYIMPAGSL